MKTVLHILILLFFLQIESCYSGHGKVQKGETFLDTNTIIESVMLNNYTENELYIFSSGEKRKYDSILCVVCNILRKKQSITVDKIEDVIPQTKEEFALYFDSLIRNEASETGHIIDSLIAIYAFYDSGDCFKRYLNMYFVADMDNSDERYMENLFYGVDYNIEANYQKFIILYNAMDELEKSVFSSFHNE